MDRLYSLFRSHFGCDPTEAIPITGSASNRRYFRLGVQGSSCIGVLGVDPRENETFCALSRHFSQKGISVPKIYGVSIDGTAYIQQDLGGDVLFDLLDSPKSEELLCKTISALPQIQFEGAQGLDFDLCYPVRRFDARLVMFDLNYFKYCFLKPSGLEFNEVFLQDDFERLCYDLISGEEAQTFLYRDFNSRNVMVKDGTPYFIDFQGGMRGPIYYDVASFIWHARSGYSDSLKEKLLNSYMEAVRGYITLDENEFREKLSKFVLFRSLQVLGAYGFRGLIEHKAKFVTAIPAALASLKKIVSDGFKDYPYLMEVLKRMLALQKFSSEKIKDGRLEVKVYSFSYKKGIPQDMSGNGGGYVFDCRSIHNPGRYEPYKKLTGRDEPVIKFLEEDGEIIGFLDHVYGVVDPHVETFHSRGFTNLMVSFGCTGGQHRSVYCAEHLAHHLKDKYPHIRVHLIHREQKIEEQY